MFLSATTSPTGSPPTWSWRDRQLGCCVGVHAAWLRQRAACWTTLFVSRSTSARYQCCSQPCQVSTVCDHDDHVTQAAIDLHWLPAEARVWYKLCLLVAYTTLLPAGHLHISPIFFNPSPSFHLVIQFCDLQLPTVCHAPDCCLVSEPSESLLPRCGINSHTTSAVQKILTLSRKKTENLFVYNVLRFLSAFALFFTC